MEFMGEAAKRECWICTRTTEIKRTKDLNDGTLSQQNRNAWLTSARELQEGKRQPRLQNIKEANIRKLFKYAERICLRNYNWKTRKTGYRS